MSGYIEYLRTVKYPNFVSGYKMRVADGVQIPPCPLFSIF